METFLQCKLVLPDLMLQEAHVTVEQGVRRREDPYGLHPRPPLHRALHRHVGEAGEAKVGALAEVAADGREGGENETDRRSHESRKAKGLPDGWAFFFSLSLLAGQHFLSNQEKDVELHPNTAKLPFANEGQKLPLLFRLGLSDLAKQCVSH